MWILLGQQTRTFSLVKHLNIKYHESNPITVNADDTEQCWSLGGRETWGAKVNCWHHHRKRYLRGLENSAVYAFIEVTNNQNCCLLTSVYDIPITLYSFSFALHS